MKPLPSLKSMLFDEKTEDTITKKISNKVVVLSSSIK